MGFAIRLAVEANIKNGFHLLQIPENEVELYQIVH